MSELTTANTEFHDPERIKLLTDLKALVKRNVSSTIHAVLWLSDIDALKELVNIAQTKSSVVITLFGSTEKNAKIIEKCKFVNFYTFSLCRFANVIQGPKHIDQSLLRKHLHD